MNNTKQATFMDLPLTWDDAFSVDSDIYNNEGKLSIPDALIRSLSNLGRVDIEYIMEISKEDYLAVVTTLKGSIFQNPDKWNENPYRGWETAEEYLSGNLRRKLRSARRANKIYQNRFSDNVFAIRKLMPEMVGAQDIYVTLGSPWVPIEIIEDFISKNYH